MSARSTEKPTPICGQERQEDTPERLIDFEGERLIIANVLTVPGFFGRVGAQLADDCFVVEQNRRVYRLALKIHEAGRDPLLSECYRAALDSGIAESLPSLSGLAYENVVEITNPTSWVRALTTKATERQLWRVAERLRLGAVSGFDVAEGIAAAREELKAIEGALNPPATTLGTIGDTVATIGIENLLAAPRGTIPMPWRRLNDLTNGGPKPGELWLVGARTGVGKSTACLQMALGAARADQRVVFISLEMPTQDLIKRALSAEGNIPHGLLVKGNLDRAWRGGVAETLDRIGQYALDITDGLHTLQAIIGKIAATPQLGLVVVDYLGLIDTGGRHENRNQEVSTISRRLKLAALDYGVPIIAAHQLNRANENEHRRPQLSDLRDSGSLEQDADTVLLLDRPSDRKRGEDRDKDAIDMLLAKQRNGAFGLVFPLRLEGRFCRLLESDPEAKSSCDS